MNEGNASCTSDQGKHCVEDPILRIGDLDAATPITVCLDDPLSRATTTMWLNNFSQLPVIKNNTDSDVCGVISWKSIGLRLSSGGEMKLVRQCMDENLSEWIVCNGTPLLDVAQYIAEHDYVLIQDDSGKVSKIVTASDLSHQFIKTARAFLTIGEIEYYLRKLFPLPQKSNRKASCCRKTSYVPGISAYVKEIEDPKSWKGFGSCVNIDIDVVSNHFKCVNCIRHDVMHFKDNFRLQQGILSSEDNEKLQNTLQFLRDLDSQQ